MLRILETAAFGLAAAAPLGAQTYTEIYAFNDVAPDGSVVQAIVTCDVNDAGEHLVLLDTQSVAGPAQALFLDTTRLYREGDAMPGFAGRTVGPVLGRPALGNAGEYKSVHLAEDGTPNDLAALLNDGSAALREGEGVFAGGAPAGAAHRDFYGADVGVGNVFMAMVGFDVGPPQPHDALMRVTHDPGIGLLIEEIVVQEGGIPVGQTQAVERLFHPSAYWSAATNERDEFAYVANLTGNTDEDGVVYLDDRLLAQEDGLCRVAGESWAVLDAGLVALENHGRVAIMGELDAGGGFSDEAVVFESRLVARAGDPIPRTTDGSFFLDFDETSSFECSDFGEVAYVAGWVDGGGSFQLALFVDHRPVVHVGETLVGGKTVTSMDGDPNAFAMSDDGRYLLVRCELDGTPSLIEVDRGPRPTEFCFGDGQADAFTPAVACPCMNESDVGDGEGCENSTGKGAYLGLQGSLSALEGDTTFSVYQARGVQPGVLVQGENPIKIPFRDGLLCMGPPTERIEVVFTDAAGHAQTVSDVAAEGNVAPGDVRGYQMWFRDPDVSLCGTGSNLTQAIVVPWQ